MAARQAAAAITARFGDASGTGRRPAAPTSRPGGEAALARAKILERWVREFGRSLARKPILPMAALDDVRPTTAIGTDDPCRFR